MLIGVELADGLSERMGLRTNGTALSEARRNKYVMGETIRSAGVRAVKQLKASTWAEISSFLEDWKPTPFKVIVKPMDSAGSDDVTLCLSVEEVRHAFGNIIGKVNGLGLVNRELLVQEYLEGQEYVVDMVSRDGIHKVAAIWAYDRRSVNGAGFVCFGQRLLAASSEHCAELIAYQKKVLDAIGIKNGPTHGEVKWCKGEPVLVEVGARCHGAEGAWKEITERFYGIDQVQMTIDAYLLPECFSSIPESVLEWFFPVHINFYYDSLLVALVQEPYCFSYPKSRVRSRLLIYNSWRKLSACLHSSVWKCFIILGKLLKRQSTASAGPES